MELLELIMIGIVGTGISVMNGYMIYELYLNTVNLTQFSIALFLCLIVGVGAPLLMFRAQSKKIEKKYSEQDPLMESD